MALSFRVVGIGEFVWDLFPSGKQPGGAPVNFAYHLTCLGDEGIPVTAVGQDPLGAEAIALFESQGLTTGYVQKPAGKPTGTVRVSVDARGQPTFDIREQVAWDFLEYTEPLRLLGPRVDVICFGSLAQRSPFSRRTTRRFLDDLPERVLRIFDVNLRQSFFEAATLRESLRRAHLVKLNHDELPLVCRLLQLKAPEEPEAGARTLLDAFSLRLVCVTRGGGGSLLVSHDGESFSHPGFPTRVVDTVGAGDAFTAALTHFYVRGASLEVLSEAGNRLGSWVASQAGATPPESPAVAGKILEQLGGT